MANICDIKLREKLCEELQDNSETDCSLAETLKEQDQSVNIDLYLRLYRNRLKESIDYPIDEYAVKKIHRKLKLEFIKIFVTNEKGDNVFAFGRELDKCFGEFKIKLIERQANIEKCLKKPKSVYTHGMEELFKYNQFYSIEALSDLHKDWKERALEFLTNLKSEQSFVGEFDSFEISQQLIREMDKEFEIFKDKNELCKFKSVQFLNYKLNTCISLYENQLLTLTYTVINQNQFLDKKESIRIEMIENFKRENSSFEQNILETYLNKLGEHFKESFSKAETVLELRLNNEQVQKKKQIERNCREYYKQQMEIKFELKKFYFQNTLIRFNEMFVRELVQKFEITSNVVKVCTEDIFNELSERNARNTPKEPAIGIDLGTTNSCVAYFSPDLKSVKSTVVIPNELGNDITPSVVSFRANNEIVVGDEAKEVNPGEEVDPQNIIHSVKRLIGKTFNDLSKDKTNQKFVDNLEYKLISVDNKPKICVRVDGVEKQYFPEEISAKVLLKLKLIAEKYLEQFKVKKVVITVPAYFSQPQKEATKQAGILAGLDVLMVINEPTAAAIAFKIDQNIDMIESTILVFDFGGGKLDVAIVRLEKGDIIVNTLKGDNYLGGDDIDNNLIDYCLNVFQTKTGKAIAKKELPIHRLRNVCEESKIKLSSVYSTKVSIKNFYQDDDLLVELTRTKFNEINKAIYERSMNLVKDAMKDARLKHTDINHIVLVGGSTHIPKIQKMLSKMLNIATLVQPINQSVAIGAAIYAAKLNGQLTQEQMFELTDVTSMSLGVENAKNEMLTLIPRNTKLPTNITRTFETHEDNQKSVRIIIYEGEERIATKNHLLGEFILPDSGSLPSRKKGEIKIDITFEMNVEGILTVSAKCDEIESKLVIKENKSRLTEEQMEDLIKKGEIELMREEEHNSFTDSKQRISEKIKQVFTFRGLPKPLVKSDDFELNPK